MPYHYYKPRGPDECVTYLQNESGRRGNHHRFITEKQVFARWAKQYNITFTHPTWWKDWKPQRDLPALTETRTRTTGWNSLLTSPTEPSNSHMMNDSLRKKKKRKKKLSSDHMTEEMSGKETHSWEVSKIRCVSSMWQLSDKCFCK